MLYRCVVRTCAKAGCFSHMEEFMRKRDESEYADEDGNEQEKKNLNDVAENNGDNGDTQAAPAGDQYKLSAKALARYRAEYPRFDHDETTGKTFCSTCKLRGVLLSRCLE